jgi:hypothetical protein
MTEFDLGDRRHPKVARPESPILRCLISVFVEDRQGGVPDPTEVV